jgi:hypothetical protein
VYIVHLSLAEAFKNYDQILLFLEEDCRLETILRKLAFHELLSERQLNEFSFPDPDKQNPGRFLRFLTAADASALLAGVVILMGADPTGRMLLRLGKHYTGSFILFFRRTLTIIFHFRRASCPNFVETVEAVQQARSSMFHL